MKKTDEQLANELDLLLTARLNDKPLPAVDEELLADMAFIDELLEMRGQLEPEPLFLSGLEAQLAAEANSEQQRATKTTTHPERGLKQAVEKPPFWENIILTLKEQLTMKRTVFALGATLALFVFAFMAWTAFQGGRPNEPGVIVETGTETTPTEVVETAEPIEVADLPLLPSLSNASGLGGGFGGGGGGDVETASGEVPAPEIGMRIFNPLSGTQFILNATLPIEPTSAVVYQQPEGQLFTVEDVSRFAGLFGLNGPIYLEQYFIEEGSEWTPTPVYQVFDGAKNLAVGSNYLYYYDDAETVFIGSGAEPMPFEQAQPIAEAFLQQTGLVDFPYRMFSPNGYDIQVNRIVDGREAIYPVFQISVNSRGQIWSFSHNPLNQLNALGEYPLRSAEAAWQYMLDNGVDFQTVFFSTFPSETPVQEPAVIEEDYRYWQRSFEIGAEVTLYSYPSVFKAVDGDAAPRIVLDYYLLSGPADQLEAIADYVGKQIHVEGIAGEMVGHRQSLELVSWEPVEKEYTFREGNIQINDGQGVLVTDEGESFIIPDVPSNLFDGERIYVSGWIDENGRGEANTFNWQGMGVVVAPPDVIEGEAEPLPIDSELVNPFGIQEVTIDQVNLQYAVLSVWDEESQSATYFLQPVWQFKGLTDSGDIIEIYVQAVDQEFVAPAPEIR